MATNNFQRIGSISNAHVGNEFEALVQKSFSDLGIVLTRDFAVPVGAGTLKKLRKFDLGSERDAMLVECKSHTWTTGGNTPSAKITVWNESMYYFHIAPEKYRKVFFALKDVRRGITLASYYVANYSHLIPDGVEIWEYDFAADVAARVR
jgi:hypothetical protein